MTVRTAALISFIIVSIYRKSLPIENIAVKSPVLMTDEIEIKRRDSTATGASKRAISERNTTPAKVSRAIAQRTLEGEGFLEFGARSMSK